MFVWGAEGPRNFHSETRKEGATLPAFLVSLCMLRRPCHTQPPNKHPNTANMSGGRRGGRNRHVRRVGPPDRHVALTGELKCGVAHSHLM